MTQLASEFAGQSIKPRHQQLKTQHVAHPPKRQRCEIIPHLGQQDAIHQPITLCCHPTPLLAHSTTIDCRVAAPRTDKARQTVRSNKGQTVRGGPRPQQRRTVSSRDGGVTGSSSGKDGYINITGFPFPLGPITQRKTYRYEVDPGRIWTFEQRQSLGFTSVSTSVRMTVIKLKDGGLWVHAPVAPTAYVGVGGGVCVYDEYCAYCADNYCCFVVAPSLKGIILQWHHNHQQQPSQSISTTIIKHLNHHT